MVVQGAKAHERIPFRLVLSEDLALCVVANGADLGEAANVELCGAELRHDGGGRTGDERRADNLRSKLRSCDPEDHCQASRLPP